MSRDLTAGALTEIAAAKLQPVLFFEGVFATDTLRLWSGVGDKSWNSLTWLGAGQLLGISEIGETADIRAESVRLSLSGMPSSLISLVHTQARHGKSGKVWIGFLDANDAVIADPYLAFSGRLDVPDIEDTGETCTISIAYENRLIDLQRARLFRWDDETQQHFYSGDRGFEYVAALQDQALVW